MTDASAPHPNLLDAPAASTAEASGLGGAAVIDRYVLSRLARGPRLKRLWYERLTEPLHLNLLSVFVGLFGSWRAKVEFDLIIRQQFAWSILRAADQARKHGLAKVALVEFGVANGAGLFNMCKIAVSATKATGVGFEIYGFDTGRGMPPAVDFRDHPEMFQESDFPMDVDRLRRALPPFCHLLIGDVEETVPAFLERLSPAAPLAFVSLDLDYYSSSKRALEVFKGEAGKYLPMVTLYLDDIVIESANPWCGECLAVNEFNAENDLRKIAPFPMLRAQRLFKNPRWLEQIHLLHVLDHPARRPRSDRASHVIANEYV
jgi:hypothetical protein